MIVIVGIANTVHLFAEDQAVGFASSNGLFQMNYSSDIDPIVINRMHSWNLKLSTADRIPVSNAEIGVKGGMPEHDHGLATRPRITPGAEEGSYRVEGMRFHMGGLWELEFTVKADLGTDTVLIPLEL